jgi:hypothetical protein
MELRNPLQEPAALSQRKETPVSVEELVWMDRLDKLEKRRISYLYQELIHDSPVV